MAINLSPSEIMQGRVATVGEDWSELDIRSRGKEENVSDLYHQWKWALGSSAQLGKT